MDPELNKKRFFRVILGGRHFDKCPSNTTSENWWLLSDTLPKKKHIQLFIAWYISIKHSKLFKVLINYQSPAALLLIFAASFLICCWYISSSSRLQWALLASDTWLWSVVVHCFRDWLKSSIFFALALAFPEKGLQVDLLWQKSNISLAANNIYIYIYRV